MPFLLTTCAIGAESVLRRLLLVEPGLRAAFARPGLISFKFEGPADPGLARPHPLIRTWGLSLGFAKNAAEVAAALQALDRPVLQVFAGEAGPRGHVPPPILEAWANQATLVRELILTECGGQLRTGLPQAGDPVLEVIVRPDEPWMLAWHHHGQGRGPLPGGGWDMDIPEDTPSRSWAKLEELIRWSGLTPQSGESVLEIGCAPGGASVALLDRGLRVCAVDPRPVVLPARLAGAPFIQRQSLIEKLPKDQYPAEADWIVVDMGVSAPVAVHALTKVVPRYRKQLKGLFITLKLNEWSLAQRIPALLQQISDLGYPNIQAASLPAFRQEIGVVAKR